MHCNLYRNVKRRIVSNCRSKSTLTHRIRIYYFHHTSKCTRNCLIGMKTTHIFTQSQLYEHKQTNTHAPNVTLDNILQNIKTKTLYQINNGIILWRRQQKPTTITAMPSERNQRQRFPLASQYNRNRSFPFFCSDFVPRKC